MVPPPPPTLKTPFLRGGYQGKWNKINILINSPCVLISKQKPRKTADYGKKTDLFCLFFAEKCPVWSNFEGQHFRLCA